MPVGVASNIPRVLAQFTDFNKKTPFGFPLNCCDLKDFFESNRIDPLMDIANVFVTNRLSFCEK